MNCTMMHGSTNIKYFNVISDMTFSKLVNNWPVFSVLFNILVTRMLTYMNMCLCRDCICCAHMNFVKKDEGIRSQLQ
jgi:hypothetical protein